jgi:hypothetical protein
MFLNNLKRIFRHSETPFFRLYQSGVLFLFSLVWLTGLTKNYFFADDFGFLRYYWHNPRLGSGTAINLGRFTVNIMFSLGSTLFSTGSVVPYSIISGILLISGLWMISRYSFPLRPQTWSFQIFTISLVYGGSISLLLWPSGVTHTGAIFFSGLGFYFLAKINNEVSIKSALIYLNCSGVCWLFVIVSNPLYVGILFIAVYGLIAKLDLVKAKLNAFQFVLALSTNLVLPFVYFYFIARPATTRTTPYSQIGIKFISQNFFFYEQNLFWSKTSQFTYALILIVALGMAFRNFKFNKLPLFLCGSSLSTLFIILIQGQQREVFYTVLPSALLLISLAISLQSTSQKFKFGITSFLAFATLVSLLAGTRQNSYFSTEPWGYKLKPFITQLEQSDVHGGDLNFCILGSKADFSDFYAGFSGGSAFQIPPFNAQSVHITSGVCPVSAASTNITVIRTPSGFFQKVQGN